MASFQPLDRGSQLPPHGYHCAEKVVADLISFIGSLSELNYPRMRQDEAFCLQQQIGPAMILIERQRSAVLVAIIIAGGFLLGASRADEAVDVLADIVVEFDLVGSDGQRVTEQNLLGRHVLLTFGFTHCPYICPTMAAAMGQALDLSEQEAIGVFISVDTERDTPTVTQAYASNFGDSMIGLSGSYEDIVAAAENFKISFAVTKTQTAYTVQHTANIYLIGPDGALREVFPLNATPATLAAAIND